MDAIADAHRESGAALFEVYRAELGSLKSDVDGRVASGICVLGLQRKWNELQNTSRDIQLLSNYLLIRYRARVLMMGQPSDSSADISTEHLDALAATPGQPTFQSYSCPDDVTSASA